jgi:capsular polysaccharide biosynthesis protein
LESIVLLEDGEEASIENAVLIDFPYRDGIFHPVALARIRAKMALPVPARKRSRVWIERLDDNRREIVNVAALKEVLEREGFMPLRNGSLSLIDQLVAWSGAALVMGVQGSDFTNMLFGPPSSVAVIGPVWFKDVFFFGLAAQLGIEWNELVCHQMVDARTPLNACSFVIDPSKFNDFVEAVCEPSQAA